MKLDFDKLRPQLDLEGKYVEFSLLRLALTVERVVRDLETNLTEPNHEGECRGTCPKCGKQRSFALNINTNRFNCFAKGCILKGGGVIDLVAKFLEVPAKDASHLLACAYDIQPYNQKTDNIITLAVDSIEQSQSGIPNGNRKVISREEFEELKNKVERLSTIVWSVMVENGEIEENQGLFN